MKPQLFHVFRNTPFGRETLLESAYFCRTVGVELVVYIPRTNKFLMYFENDVVQVDLDSSYLISPHTARDHAKSIIVPAGLEPIFFEPKEFTASSLPDIPTYLDYMCCPRTIADLSSKIGLGYIGSPVRRIVKNARFPVYIPNPVFKEWKNLAVFFGGSENALKALRLGIKLSRLSDFPLLTFTRLEGETREKYEEIIRKNRLEEGINNWTVFDGGEFNENLHEVPHDALVIVGLTVMA